MNERGDVSIEQTGLRTPEIGSKGLKGGALGFLSNVVIGVASTAPGYSLAATLGFVAAVVGVQSPAILWLAFLPMLFIAASYYYMNKADPDCGTTFTWVTKAMGPRLGWLGGWAIVVADVIVMANLAQIAGLYTFLLLGWQSAANSVFAVTLVGVIWIAVLTTICVIGIELSARTQFLLLGMEIVTLAVFAVVALFEVYTGFGGSGAITPSLSWINPFAIQDWSALNSGLILAIFIYWGWDTTVTVNEESENSDRTPGVAALVSTVVLLAIYVVVAIAAQAYGGVPFLIANQEDVLSSLGTQVLGSPFDKILILSVLTSAAASTQTTILPTARTTLSMARYEAIPDGFGKVHPRFLTPHVSTIWMGVLSIVWYVGLTLISQNILFDSLSALGLMIAFYYGLTGFACAIYYRNELTKSVKNFVLVGVTPVVGGLILTWALIQQVITLSNPAEAYTGSLFGIGAPLVIAIASLLLGILLMLWMQYVSPAFFRRHTQTSEPDILSKATHHRNR
ncbi:APC family permease [Haladaptatus caseinilyticus]|uniref:APC family permease n=1 Tax=Haladaptatus caseinilyticus TaxID=2993314 RepID=UPI00224AE171|nr:APC family permease [Haladaptatus caseinilyticus]